MAAACSGSAWSCPRQWSNPWTASRRSSATPSGAWPIARSTEIATSPTLAALAGGKREHVGGRVGAEKSGVEILKLRVAGQADGQARPRWDVEAVTAGTEQRPEACVRDSTTLPRAEARIADDGHPHGRELRQVLLTRRFRAASSFRLRRTDGFS